MPRVTRKALETIDNAVEAPAIAASTAPVKTAAKATKATKPRARKAPAKKNAAAEQAPAAEPAKQVTFAAEPQPSHMEEENKQLKATIEELTSKLAAVSVVSSSAPEPAAPAAPAAPKPNPFGVELPVPAPCAGARPARPASAYSAFQREQREAVRAAHPDATFGEINTRLAALWKDAKADAATLARYEGLVAADKARYDAEMVAYKARVERADLEKAALSRLAEKQKMEKALALYERHIQGESLDAPMGEPADVAEPTAAAAAAAAAVAAVPDVKKARNAYAFFTARRHRELSAQDAQRGPDEEKLTFAQKAGQISQEWAALQKSRRKADKAALAECTKLAADDAERYRTESAAAEELRAAARMEAQRAQDEVRRQAVAEYTAELAEKEAVESAKRAVQEARDAVKAERKAAREEKKAAKLARAGEPKRARTAYQLFFSDHATPTSVKIKAGEIVDMSLAAAVGAQWKSADEAQRRVYADRAAEDKQRYIAEMAEFTASKAAQQ